MRGPLADNVATGGAITFTVTGDELETQPAAFVMATEYVPDVVTRIVCVVAPLLQRYEADIATESVTLLPEQNVVGPDGVIVAFGMAITLMRAVSVTFTLPQPGCVMTIVITFTPGPMPLVFTGIVNADPVPLVAAETAVLFQNAWYDTPFWLVLSVTFAVVTLSQMVVPDAVIDCDIGLL